MPHRDTGLGLVELLVAMTIFSAVAAMCMSVLIAVQRQTRDTALRDDAVGQARLALATMDRQIRSGNVLLDPTGEAALGFPMSMRILTEANAVSRCVQWQIIADSSHPGTKMLRSRSWSWPLVPSEVIVWTPIARGLLNAPTDPIAPFRLEGSPAYGNRLVNINLLVKSPDDSQSAGGRPITVATSLSGRNTVYVFVPGICTPIPPA